MPKRFSEIASRLSGISCPLFGVSWEPATSDVAVARQVIAFLEDRRVLYEPSEVEVAEHCVTSVIQIRATITSLIGAGGFGQELAEHLRAIRAACRDFLKQIHAQVENDDDLWRSRYSGYPSGLDDWNLNQALGRLRGLVGVHVAQIAVRYGVDVEDDLASILPLE
jgi:hypothetical protein